jgi:SAM-dependent methyltransferase
VSDPRTELVGAGYDAMADTWEAWSAHVGNDPRAEWLARLVALVPPGGRVVELGCGNGRAETIELSERFHLTGVDLSAEQLRRARRRVPAAEFLHADFTAVEFEPGSLDAVCSFYVFNHVPRDLLPGLLARIHGWLRPGGVLLGAFGASDIENWQGDWLGVPMYFSGFEPAQNRRLLDAFELVEDEVVTISEPEGDVTFHWVLARR